jgi:acetyl-CoA carboxylase/biotin carboxylase 1
VEIKYKQKDILKTMHRLDSKIKALVARQNTTQSKEEADQIKKQIEAREKELTSVYEQVAISFADLHDTPGRMKAKGCIREVLTWKTSRQYFFYRVKRRLNEEYLKKNIAVANPTFSEDEVTALLQEWMKDVNDDKAAVKWFDTQAAAIKQKLKHLREGYVKLQVANATTEDPASALSGLLAGLDTLPHQQKLAIMNKLKEIASKNM